MDSSRDGESRIVFQYGEGSPSVGWKGMSGSSRLRQGSSGGIQMQKGAEIYWRGGQSLAGNTFTSSIKQPSKVLTLAKSSQP